MAKALYALKHLPAVRAPQHIDHVVHAKTLPRAIDTGQRLLRGHSSIPGLRRCYTVVAITTGLVQCFIKVTQQHLPSASVGFTQAQHGIQFVPLYPLATFLSDALFLHLPQGNHILQTIGHPGITGQTVATGTTCLLIIGFNTFRQVQVGNETHIGLIDTHTESDGGHYNHTVLAQKTLLILLSKLRAEAGVIGQGGKPLFGEPLGRVIHPLARQAVNDARLALVVIQNKAFELIPGIPLILTDVIANIRSVEAAVKDFCILQIETFNNFTAGGQVGGRRQRNARHRRKSLVQNGKLLVFGPEIVPPLGYTVGLVDRKQGDVCLPHQIQHARCNQPLRGDIDQIEIALTKQGFDPKSFVCRQR